MGIGGRLTRGRPPRGPSVQTAGHCSSSQLRRGKEAWTTRSEKVKGQRGHEGPSRLQQAAGTPGQKGLFTQRPTRSRPRPRVNY